MDAVMPGKDAIPGSGIRPECGHAVLNRASAGTSPDGYAEPAGRLARFLLIGSMVGLSWLGMQIVHELGHVLDAVLTGGRVDRVILHPLSFSRTDVSFNRHPLAVAWAGAIAGVMMPVAVWALVAAGRRPGRHVLRFFAGFCLLANGGYLSFGTFDHVGDAGDLLKLGAAAWQLWLFGGLTMPAGLMLWHRLGSHFGLGHKANSVRPKAAWFGMALLLAVVLAELGWSAATGAR